MLNLQSLQQRWETEHVDMLPPRSSDDVRAAFASLGATLTDDVLEMYTTVGGMQVPDNELWMLWPLDEVVKRNAEPSPHGLLFSDFLLDSHGYRLQANSDGTSAVLRELFDGSEPVRIADSLSQFFMAYASKGVSVLDPFVPCELEPSGGGRGRGDGVFSRLWKSVAKTFETRKATS